MLVIFLFFMKVLMRFTFWQSPHGYYIHIDEAISLVEDFIVEKVIFNCGAFNELEQDLIKVLNKKKINRLELSLVDVIINT